MVDNSETDRSKQNVIILTIVIITSLLNLPTLFIFPQSGLDDSWFTALHLVKRNQFVWGTDVVFTYGPLGYLVWPVFIEKGIWLQSLTFSIAITVVFYTLLAALLLRFRISIMLTILLMIASVGLFEHYIVLCILVSFVLIIAEENRSLRFSIPVVFFCALALYIKLSMGLMVFLILVVYLMYLVSRRRLRESGIVVFSYTAAVAAFGYLLIGNPAELLSYFHHAYQIVNFYSIGMAIDGPRHQLVPAFVSWIWYGCLIVFCSWRADFRRLTFLVLAGGPLFASFKLGFVRHDLHVLSYFGVWSTILVLFLIFSIDRRQKLLRLITISIVVWLLHEKFTLLGRYTNIFYVPLNIEMKVQHIRHCLSMVLQDDSNAIKPPKNQRLRRRDSLDQGTLTMLGDQDMDIIPWDISVCARYNLRWTPRPVFQSYQAYHPSLDLLNSSHFSKPESPEYVLLTLQSIDGRYPPFDEPATFRNLLSYYKFSHIDRQFVILQRNSDPISIAQNDIGSVAKTFGELVTVPNATGLIFARISIRLNICGKVAKTLYKPPLVYIQFRNGTWLSPRFRFIYPNGLNGVLISKYLEDVVSLKEIWSGESENSISHFSITSDNPGYFEETIRIDFFSVVR